MSAPYYADDSVTLHHGDCLDVLRALPDNSVDSVVTDPPYGLEFMGKDWDAPWKASGTVLHDPSEVGGFQDGNAFSRSRVRYGREGGDSRAFGEWCELWTAECLRVLKPGGHLLAFGGTRTWHRLACAVEDAGFEVRDSIAWLYGSGFPKSLDVSKAIDKAAGADREVVGVRRGGVSNANGATGAYNFRGRDIANGSNALTEDVLITAPATPAAEQWQGWGTALKPAFEPVVVARKPLVGTVAGNVLTHGTGALNIGATRIENADYDPTKVQRQSATSAGMNGLGDSGFSATHEQPTYNAGGRWPANVVLDDTQAAALDEQSGTTSSNPRRATGRPIFESSQSFKGGGAQVDKGDRGHADSGGASRFFYVAKASKSERPNVDGTAHPTVKPLTLMRWLVRLVTPPGGTVLEPFAGSGTTVEACLLEGFRCIAIEKTPEYLPLILARIERANAARAAELDVEPDLFTTEATA